MGVKSKAKLSDSTGSHSGRVLTLWETSGACAMFICVLFCLAARVIEPTLDYHSLLENLNALFFLARTVI